MVNYFRGVLSRVFNAMSLDFGPGNFAQSLTLTFKFVQGLAGLLALLTASWSVAAGISQGGRLSMRLIIMFAHSAPPWCPIALWLGPLVGIFAYALRAYAVAMLLCLAAACVGGVMGFLFGVPRPNAQMGGSPTGGGGAATPVLIKGSFASGSRTGDSTAPSNYQASTNLTEISDWLTKIIVGVGLVEIKSLVQHAESLSQYIGSQLFGGLASAGLVLPALMLIGLLLGFIATFLFTQLVLAAMISQAAGALGKGMSAYSVSAAVLTEVAPTSLALAPNLKGEGVDGPLMAADGSATITAETPSARQLRAAQNIQSLPLDSIEDPEMIRVWSRAQALLSRYDAAASGYTKLLQKIRTPDVLAEAARVFGADRNPAMARQLLNEAAAVRNVATPDLKASITFDAANMALYDPPPAGFNRALELLDDETLKTDSPGTLHVLRACANGQRLKYRDKELNDDARSQLRSSIMADLKYGLTVNVTLSDWVRYLLGLTGPDGGQAGTPRDDDLHGIFSPEEVGDILIVCAQSAPV